MATGLEGLPILGQIFIAASVVLTPPIAVWMWVERRFATREELKMIRESMERRLILLEAADVTQARTFREIERDSRAQIDSLRETMQTRFDEMSEMMSDLREAIARIR